MTTTRIPADRIADRIADDLADPGDVQRRYRPPRWWPRSLASGALGVALLHVERARAGRASWSIAHAWLSFATAHPVDEGPGSHLHYGAPALAYVLHHATTDHVDKTRRSGRYARALDVLDARIARTTTARVAAAHRRIDAGHTPALCEFDAIRGLTGLGVYWLRRDPAGPRLRGILGYLVRLTEPLRAQNGAERPGWWTHLAPNGRRRPEFPDGHANNGLSHGITGPLALLALAARAGHHVPGHCLAIQRVLDWLDTHQHGENENIGWPYWTTSPDPDGGNPRASRPSWCYGTPGIARAQQLAGIALGDPGRTRAAETALIGAITSADLPVRLNNPGLCHGRAGALLITRRAAADSTDPRLVEQPRRLRHLLRADPLVRSMNATALGLLDGPAGTVLALDDNTPPGSGWDSCLLTS